MRCAGRNIRTKDIFKSLFAEIAKIPDQRQAGKVRYELSETIRAALAMFYFQVPSFRDFHLKMRTNSWRRNMKRMFGVNAIPNETQMREIIDGIEPDNFRNAYKCLFYRLQRDKKLEQFCFIEGMYICLIDGSGFFGSGKVHCPGCIESNHKNGETTYSHQMMAATIVHPDNKAIIPLMPEEIRNTDGRRKQDCEIKAAKRLLPKIRKDHPQLPLIIVGDSKFSKQPLIELMGMNRLHYLLVAKPGDHKFLMNYVKNKKRRGQVKTREFLDNKGVRHVYEWINDVPLFAYTGAFRVNFLRYYRLEINNRGVEKITYQNAWVTDLEVTRNNVKSLTDGGLARWKIENECFNTLKNQGYHAEHNYGHGEQHLSFNFLLLTILAFLIHQIYELTDRIYQKCRKIIGSKVELWCHIRSYFRNNRFYCWEFLLKKILNPP